MRALCSIFTTAMSRHVTPRINYNSNSQSVTLMTVARTNKAGRQHKKKINPGDRISPRIDTKMIMSAGQSAPKPTTTAITWHKCRSTSLTFVATCSNIVRSVTAGHTSSSTAADLGVQDVCMHPDSGKHKHMSTVIGAELNSCLK